MIIEALCEGIYLLMDKLLAFHIPLLPAEVQGYIDTAFDYISAGAGVVANYVPLGYFWTLFGLILAIDASILVYHFVMWVIRKLPIATE